MGKVYIEKPGYVYDIIHEAGQDSTTLKFMSQTDGPGITNEDVLNILVNRLSVQYGKQPDDRTLQALQQVQAALAQLEMREVERTMKRAEATVEDEKHKVLYSDNITLNEPVKEEESTLVQHETAPEIVAPVEPSPLEKASENIGKRAQFKLAGSVIEGVVKKAQQEESGSIVYSVEGPKGTYTVKEEKISFI